MDWIDYSKIITSFLTGILGVLGYLDIVRNKSTNQLTTLGKIGLFLLFTNVLYLIILQFFELKSSNTKYKATIDSLSYIIDKSNTTLSRLENVQNNLEMVESDLLDINAGTNKNLESQKELLIKSERILNPIRNIDFTLTLEYDFETDFDVSVDSTLYYNDLQTRIKNLWDSICIAPELAKFKLDYWEEYKNGVLILHKDSTYQYKDARFIFSNNELKKVALTPESELFRDLSMDNYLLDVVNLEIILSEKLEYNEDYYFHLFLLDKKRELPGNILQNNKFLSSSDKTDLWIHFDFQKNKIFKKINQPFVYKYWQGKKTGSIKDFEGLKLHIRDANLTLREERWPPQPSRLQDLVLLLNTSHTFYFNNKKMHVGSNGFVTLGELNF